MSRAVSYLCALSLAAAGQTLAADCTRTSVGLVPLNDLGTGSYRGEQGGLYPGGRNGRRAPTRAACSWRAASTPAMHRRR